jgi:hypothetical protein
MFRAKETNKQEVASGILYAGCLLGLLFGPEDGDMIVRNETALQYKDCIPITIVQGYIQNNKLRGP